MIIEITHYSVVLLCNFCVFCGDESPPSIILIINRKTYSVDQLPSHVLSVMLQCLYSILKTGTQDE